MKGRNPTPWTAPRTVSLSRVVGVSVGELTILDALIFVAFIGQLGDRYRKNHSLPRDNIARSGQKGGSEAMRPRMKQGKLASATILVHS